MQTNKSNPDAYTDTYYSYLQYIYIQILLHSTYNNNIKIYFIDIGCDSMNINFLFRTMAAAQGNTSARTTVLTMYTTTQIWSSSMQICITYASNLVVHVHSTLYISTSTDGNIANIYKNKVYSYIAFNPHIAVPSSTQ